MSDHAEVKPLKSLRIRVTVNAYEVDDAITALRAVAGFLETNTPNGVSTIACHEYEAAMVITHVSELDPAPPAEP